MTIERFLRREIDAGSFPSASWAVGSSRGIDQTGFLGQAVAVPLRIAAAADTIYDCASITKPLITTTLILLAVAEHQITLDDRFQGFTYRELLTHTSGLRAWMPLYAYDDYLRAILDEGRECERGTRVIYSDLNFIMLWYAARAMYGDFIAAAGKRIFGALQLRDAMVNPMALLPASRNGGGGHPTCPSPRGRLTLYCRRYSTADVDLSLFTLPRISG